jgi:hypothetical protein
MSDPTLDEGTQKDVGASESRIPTVGMPRWVTISLIVVGLLIAVFVVLQLVHVGPRHGPQRHFGPGMHQETPSSMESGRSR